MAPVFVLLQEVEKKRGGGPLRGSGPVGAARVSAPATAAAEQLPRRQAAQSGCFTAPVMIPQPLTCKQVGGCFTSPGGSQLGGNEGGGGGRD